MTITEFKKLLRELSVSELRKLKSFVVTADGEYLCTFINPNTDYIKLTSENLVRLSNSIGGEELNDILQAREAVKMPSEKPKKRKRRVKSHATV